MKYIKRFFGVSALLAIGFAVWWMGMNYNGYCHAEGRYLSDEERINSAVQYVLASYPQSVSNVEVIVNDAFQRGPNWVKPKQTIKYKDVGEFLEINLNCCELSMALGVEAEPTSLLDRITGYISTFVIVRYKIRYLDDDNIEKYNDGGQAVSIKNCGQAW